LEKLDVAGNVRFTGALMPNGSAGTTGEVLVSQGAGNPPQWSNISSYGWSLSGNSLTGSEKLGSTNNYPVVVITNNQETFRFNPPGSSAPAWSIQRGGGNQRGLHAVDLQSARALATQVASGDYSVIGGGYQNTASNLYATVGGGYNNTTSDDFATVGGGYNNTASGYIATVGGGRQNTASGDYSAIPGGYNLRVGGRSFGFSGQTSPTQTDLSTNSNIAAFVDVDLWLYNVRNQASKLRLYEPSGSGTNYTEFVARAQASNITYTLPADLTLGTLVSGGRILQSDASGNLSWLDPAALAAATAWARTGNAITGTEFLGTTNNQPLVIQVNSTQTFQFNTNLSLQRDAGGNSRGTNAVDLQSARALVTQVASGNYSVIGGGYNNTASGNYATVGGGQNNTASDAYATVGGGWSNTASGYIATVGGGKYNTASRDYATVGGGFQNTASEDGATVGGGLYNTASGIYSVVPGGYSNTANGAYNLVFGQNVDPSVNETHRVYLFGDGSASPSRPSGFLVINRLDGDYPIHVGTDNTNGNGARLTAGGVWTNGSSRSFKERFVQYRPAEVLEKIRQLPVEGYFYKGTEEYHITPMAEDFYRLFGTGVHEIIETDSTGQLVRRPNPDVDKYLAASDVAGVALLGVQALAERVDMLQPQSGALAQRLEALEQENQQIKQENQRLRQQLEQVMKRLALLEAQHSNLAESQK
jgi:hypothetical protein